MFKTLRKLSLISMVMVMLLVNVAAPIYAAQATKTNEIVLVSFNDGAFDADEKGAAHIDSGCSIVDDVAFNEDGQSLKWMTGNNRIEFKLQDRGISKLDGTVTINLRFKGTPSETTTKNRFRAFVYDTNGTEVWKDQNYPIESSNWSTISVTINNTTFWTGRAQAFFRLDTMGAYASQASIPVYIDSVWAEYKTVENTARYQPWTRVLHEFNVSEKPTDISGSYGAYTEWGANFIAPGSSSSLKVIAHSFGMFFYSDNRSAVDWTEYDNVVFRIKAVNQGSETAAQHDFYFIFANNARTRYDILNAPIVEKKITVTDGEWNDYKIPVSELKDAYEASATGKTIGAIRLYHTSKDAAFAAQNVNLYIDSIFLEKTPKPKLTAPDASIVEGETVAPYIDGDNNISFTYKEALSEADYNDGVEVYANNVLSTEKYSVSVNNNTLNVHFPDALKPDTNYKVVLKADKIRSEANTCTAADTELSFKTLPADVTGVVSLSQNGTDITATANIKNTTVKPSSAVLLLGVYNSNGTFNTVLRTDKALSSVEDATATVTADGTLYTNCIYKAFIFNNIVDITPLGAAAETID